MYVSAKIRIFSFPRLRGGHKITTRCLLATSSTATCDLSERKVGNHLG